MASHALLEQQRIEFVQRRAMANSDIFWIFPGRQHLRTVGLKLRFQIDGVTV
jgi:hypothetical protein